MSSISELTRKAEEPTPSHYARKCACGSKLDPYRIALIYGLNPMADHIVKKALCAGNRGHKDLIRDLDDIIATATRWKEIVAEDAGMSTPGTGAQERVPETAPKTVTCLCCGKQVDVIPDGSGMMMRAHNRQTVFSLGGGAMHFNGNENCPGSYTRQYNP